MKKLFTTLNAVLVAAALLLSSCSYDDSGLLSELDKVKGDVSELQGDLASLTERVAALEESLEAEVEALKAMVNGLTTVSGCEAAANGDVTVSLSNGKSFTVYAEPEHTAVTVYTENGVQYWATVGANDTIVPVKDANGNMVPVVPVKEEAVLPQFQATEDGKVAVSFDGGKTWSNTGAASTSALEKVSVFSGVEIVKVANVYGTDITYQAKFTLADGNTFLVDLDPKYYEDYAQTFGTQFQIIDGYSGSQVTALYVPAGGEDVLQSVSGNIVDFLIEKPAGWKVVPEDLRAEGEPEAYWVFTVKAPSQEAIDAGFADEVGTVKIVAVTGSGKVIPASVDVSSNPLKSVSVAGGNISVKTYGSNVSYVCGLTPYSAYSEETLSAAVLKLYDYMDWTWTWPEELGAYMQYAGNLEASVSELLGKDQDQSYVFWITFPEQDDESGAVNVGKFVKAVAPYVSVEVLEAYAGDAKISVKMDTTDKFFAKVFALNYYGQDPLTQLENNLGNLAYYYDEDYNATLPYEGKISELVQFGTKVAMTPSTTYVLGVLPYDKEKLEKNAYTVDDAIMVEFTTASPSVQNADLGAVSVTSTTIGISSLKAVLAKPSTAASLYAQWVDAATLATLTNDADKVAYLLANGKTSKSASYTLSGTGSENSDWTLLAVAFSADWEYGTILQETYKTKTVSYNDLAVSITGLTKGPYTDGSYAYIKGLTVQWGAVTGAAGYRVAVLNKTTFETTYQGSADKAVEALMDGSSNYFQTPADPTATTYEYPSTMYAYQGPFYVLVVAYTEDASGNKVYSHAAYQQVEITAN